MNIRFTPTVQISLTVMDAKLSISNDIINNNATLLICDKKIISNFDAKAFSLFNDSAMNPNAKNQQISINDLKQIVLGEAPKELALCRENAILYYQTGDIKYKKLSNSYKDKLKYVTISGVINGLRSDKNLTPNGFAQIDIDCKYLDGNIAASEIKSFIIKKIQDKTLSYLVMCAFSPSLHGVKCIVATNNISKERFKTVLESVKFELSEILKGLNLGFAIDNLGLSQPCYIPYDSEAFFNEDYTLFQYTHVEIEKAFHIKESKYTIDSKSIVYTNAAIELSINTKLDMLESIIKKRNRYNDSRNCFVFQLASMAKEYNINCFECLSYCLNYCESDFAEVEIKRVVNSAYKGTPKVQYLDYQLIAYAKKTNTYVPTEILTAKPRLIAAQKSVETIAVQNFLGEKGEYFSNILLKNNYALTVENFTNKQWIVPTGVGKTNTIAQFPYNKIIICPTKGLVKMCGEKYGATIWTGDEHNIHAILKANFIATTYASFLTLCYEMQQNQHFITDTLQSQLFSLKKDFEAKRMEYDTTCSQFKERIKSLNDKLKVAQTSKQLTINEMNNIEILKEHINATQTEFNTFCFQFDKPLNESSNQLTAKQLEINEIQSKDILKRHHVFLDESHNVVANANKGYQLKDLESILERVKDCASFTCVTGTYLRSNILKMPIINVSVPQKRIPLNVITCEVVRDVLIEKIIQSVQNKRFPIVFLNNTSNELERLKASLSDYKIAYFNAHNKQDADYQQLINTSDLNASLHGIVTTSVLKEGIDINNAFDFDFYFVGRHHSSTIKQVIARSRSKTNDVKAYLLRSLDAENDANKRFDYELEKYNLDKRTNHICEILNLTRLENYYNEISNLESDLVQRFENMPLHFSEKTQRYEIRPLLFDNHLYEIETTYESQNLNLLKENLSKLSIDLVSESKTTEITEKQDAFLQDSAVETKKDKEKKEFNAIIETINKNPLDARNKILKMYKSNTISKIEKKTYKILKMCLDYGYKFSVVDSSDDTITLDATKDIKILIELPTEKNFKAFTGILKAYVLRTNELYMNHNSIVAIQIKAFLSKFEGKTLTKDEIKALTIDVMTLNKGINITAYNDASEKDNMRKFFDVLSLFFNITRTQKKRGENVYKFAQIELSIPKKQTKEIEKECKAIEKEFNINNLDWLDFMIESEPLNYLNANERITENIPF